VDDGALFAVYLTIIIYSSSSKALARDIALASGVIYDRNTFIVQTTAEIITYDCKLQLQHFYSTGRYK
jgi:hypothetical protein